MKHIPMAQYRRAQAIMRSRPKVSRKADRSRKAKITRDVNLWASNPSSYDIPGIDKKRKKRRVTRRRVSRK